MKAGAAIGQGATPATVGASGYRVEREREGGREGGRERGRERERGRGREREGEGGRGRERERLWPGNDAGHRGCIRVRGGLESTHGQRKNCL